MKRKKLFMLGFELWLVIILVVFPLMGCGGGEEVSETKTLEIGLLCDMTGFLSDSYLDQSRECENIAQIVNEEGGITIQGQKYEVKLVKEDSKSTIDGAVSGANKLVFDHKVKYIVGPLSFEGAAITSLLEENKIIHVINYPTKGPGEMGAEYPYTFAGDYGAVGQGMLVFQILKKYYPDVKRVVFIMNQQALANLEDSYSKALTDMGYTVLNGGKAISYPDSWEDYSPIAVKIDALNPDAVVNPSGAGIQQDTNIVKRLRELGNNAPYIFGCMAGAKPVQDIIGTDPVKANDIYTTGISRDYAGNPPVLKKLIPMVPEDRPVWGTLANGLYVLCQVIREADSLEPEVIKSTWESLDTVESVFGTSIFSGDETYGIHHHAVGHSWFVQKLDQGQIVDVGWVSSGPIP